MRKFFALIFTVICIISCSPSEPERPTTWEAEALVGKTLTLIDDKKLEEYRFGQEHFVAAAFGIKDGPIAAPLFYWKIADGKLVISESEEFGSSLEELTAVSKHGRTIKVRRKSGEAAEYKLGKM
jgi:hypothetical protein